MMNIRPVSIVVCTHNRADLLPSVLSQLRAQEYPHDAFEIIVVDNRSTDHTRRVIQQLVAEPGVPLRYLYEPRPGVTFARNRGAKEARYPYVAYCDDDCSVDPDWLGKLMGGFGIHHSVVAVGGLVVLRFDRDRPWWLSPALEPYLGTTDSLGNRPRVLNDDERIVEFNMALTLSAWQASGGFLGMEQFGSRHMAAGEGLYLLHQLRRYGGKIAFVPQAVMHHHVRWRTTRRWMLQRSYWQGVSNALLEHLLQKWSKMYVIRGIKAHLLPFFLHLGHTALSLAEKNKAESMVYLVQAVEYLGRFLGGMHVLGDWRRVRMFASSEHQVVTSKREWV